MRKFGVLLASAFLLTSVASVKVNAAQNLDISKTPHKLTLHEPASIVLPWNADYGYELAGARGGGVEGVNGSYGTVVAEVCKRISKGAKLDVIVGRSPTTGVSTGGALSALSVDGNLYAIAGGGAGNVPSYNLSDKTSPTSSPLSVAGGCGSYKGSDGYVTYHTHTTQPDDTIPRRPPVGDNPPSYFPGDAGPIGCYIGHLHGHHTEYGCEKCQCEYDSEGNCKKHKHTWRCGKQQGWATNCGKANGDIVTLVDGTHGGCIVPNGATVTQSNQGNGYFILELCEHTNLLYANTQVRLPYYRNEVIHLIIVDDTVVYYVK